MIYSETCKYETTTKFDGLTRLMVFLDKENKNYFVKNVPGKWWNLCVLVRLPRFHYSGGCFTNVSQALQNNLAKIHNTGNHIYGENFKLKLGTCAQSMALGTHKFQLEILMKTTISANTQISREYLGELEKR